MLEVVLRKQFKKDYSLAKKRGKYNMPELNRIMLELASEKTLPEANYDHPLIGNYSGYRECHIAGDWLLVYKVIGNQIFFARTGTHTDIFD